MAEVADTIRRPLSRLERQRLLQEAKTRLEENERSANDLETLQLAEIDGSSLATRVPRIPRLRAGELPVPYVTSTRGVAQTDERRLLDESERVKSRQSRRVEDPVLVQERKKQQKQADAGAEWFNLPKTDLTPELKRDLQLLKMRGVLDPKRFYKKDSSKSPVPTFSQVGTIVAGPTEYYSSRLPNKDRKRTLVEEILSQEKAHGNFKKKYNDIQNSKTSGKRAFYRKLKEKRGKRGS